ncbi:MAG: Sec-independent protein translocase subunit TatA [Steroidobacteraceae bacterium]
MGGLGMRELLIILLVVLVVFGTKKLRSVGQDLGAAVRGFKKAMNDGETEQSTPPKQLGSEAPDAQFDEARKTEAPPKSDRSV